MVNYHWLGTVHCAYDKRMEDTVSFFNLMIYWSNKYINPSIGKNIYIYSVLRFIVSGKVDTNNKNKSFGQTTGIMDTKIPGTWFSISEYSSSNEND